MVRTAIIGESNEKMSITSVGMAEAVRPMPAFHHLALF